jgi:lysophospholipase L1-like esterase
VTRPTRRPRGTASLVVVLVAALVWLLWPSGPAGAQQRRVVVVGDSVILGAEGPIVSSFSSRGWAVTFDAAVNRSTSAGLEAIQSHRAELTDSLVVNLGANDAGNTAAYRQRVQAILDATADVPHVYWVTIREVRDYYGPANQAVRELAAGRPNVTVIDWHAATAGATDLTASDGLHLNGGGAARMAQVVTDAVVAGALPAAAPPPAPAPPAEAPTTVPPTTAAPPSTATPPSTAAPSTAAPTTESPTTTEAPGVERAAGEELREIGDSTLVDGDTIWTVGGGVAVMVLVLALAGVVLAVWSLARAGRAAPRTSPAHPAVRARQRAQRIAEAAATADSESDTAPDTGQGEAVDGPAGASTVGVETQKT